MSNKDLLGTILQSSSVVQTQSEHTPESVADAWLKIKKKKKVQLVVSIEADLMESIEKIAFTKGCSKSRVVEDALSKGIRK